MASITISDLRPASADLNSDSESYLMDMTDPEMARVEGGFWGAFVFGIFKYVGWWAVSVGSVAGQIAARRR